MADPNPSNHWDSLLSDIGVTPPSEDKLRQPEPKEQPPAKPAKSATTRRPSPQKASDWDSIADDLGLQPQPKREEPPRAKAEPPRAKAEPPVVSEVTRPTSVTPERGEESPNFFDERFDFEEPFDLLEPNAADSADEPKPAKAKAETEQTEKRPRKRRRRRRPAKDSETRKAELPADEDVVGFTPEPSDDEISIKRKEGEESKTDEAGEKRRTKRRRPRRGKKRKSTEETKRKESPGEIADIGESDDAEEQFEEVGDSDKARPRKKTAGEGSVRSGFRGIPTWEEAVGMLVEKNLEGRSKRPEGGSQRGRGRKRRSS